VPLVNDSVNPPKKFLRKQDNTHLPKIYTITKICKNNLQLLQPPSSPVKKKPAPIVPPKPVSSKDKFRPITPTETIIGSLWDDINRELEKYKEERKKQKSDPNLSPKSSTPCSSFSSISHLHSKQEVEGGEFF